jgi:ABC-2 type transport system ATP-binding protein
MVFRQTLTEGLLHGIIGPEGAGKTTLLRSLLGLLKPDQGSIQFTDHGNIINYNDIRSSVAYMPQQQSLYADLSISEHLDFFRDLYQIPDDIYQKRRKDLLQITRLDKFTDRPAGKLSGGMYKKLGLMCALLQSPSAILLDEPTNGVDPISRREFWDLLYRLSKEKILILFATAYMDEAERCDHVHVLSSGKLIAEGPPRKILEQENVKNYDALFLKKSAEGLL